MALSDAIADVQAKALTLSGMAAAPTNVPEAMNQFPFAVSYAKEGEVHLASSGFGNYLHTIVCEIHVARLLLPTAIALALPYIESFASKILNDPKLSNTVSTTNAIRYSFGVLRWAGEEHIGARFEIEVKIALT